MHIPIFKNDINLPRSANYRGYSKLNAGIILPIHGSIDAVLNKTGGNSPEFLAMDVYSKKFDKVFVFSHDSKDFRGFLPKNCTQVRSYNRFLYLIFGWIFVLVFTIRSKLRVLYVVSGPALPQIFLVNKLTKAKVLVDYVYRWYGTAGNPIKKFFLRILESFLLNFVDYVVANSGEIRKFVNDENKILDLKPGVDLKKFNPNIESNEIFKKIGGKTIIFVGRLTDVKDPVNLIKAYKIAKQNIPNLSLIICGDGELREECEQNSDSDVHFLGIVQNTPTYLKGADAFVLPSKYDASPRALMEAMAMGKACIATNVGGIPDFLSGCGILVEPENPELLAEKIVYLLNSPTKAKKLGDKAKERAEKYYNLEKNIERGIEFLIKNR